jgi:predicted signal transduction protein with EAL and GGDEF domain
MRRFRFSVRFLMIVVALCALLLAPIVWEYRQNQRLVRAEMRAVQAAERARVEAERARYVAQVRHTDAFSGVVQRDATIHQSIAAKVAAEFELGNSLDQK